MEYSFGGYGDGGSGDWGREVGSPLGLSYSYCSSEELQSELGFPVYDPSCCPDGLIPEDDKAMVTPVLQYISDMLMDEQMEDRIFMLQECSAYQAMAKGFYEILGEEEGARGPGRESDGADEWINGLLNLDPMTPTESASTLSTASPEMGIADLSPEWLCSSSGDGYQIEGDLVPSFSYPSDASGSAFQSDEQLHQHWNGVGLQDNHSAAGGLRQVVPYVTGQRMLGDAVLENDAFMRTIGNLDGPIYAQDALRSRAFAAAIAIGQRDSGFDANPLQAANSWWLPSAAMDTASSAAKEALSFVQNKELNAECSAKLLQDGPLPSCTLRKQEAMAVSSKHGSGKGSSAKRPDKQCFVDLRSRLVSCAQAVADSSLRTAHELLQEIRQHASPYGTATERLAYYFAEALDARISGTGPGLYTAIANNRPSAAKMLKSYHSYVEVCPFGTLSHFFANQSILKAAEGASRLHIVDYGILYGFQWPCLMSALAERKGGPPHLRITGIEFPHPGPNPEERVQETGLRLREYANAYGVPFEYRAIASKWEAIQPASLNIRQDELLIVNCMNRLRHLMDETVIPANPRKAVLSKVKSMSPKLFVQGIVNAGLNAPFFMSRFREALFYYSSKLDILDTTIEDSDNPERLMVEQELIGRDILNVVACEGLERVERPETYRQCQLRTQRAGFELLPLDLTVMSKGRAILKSYHKDFTIDGDGKWLLLGWKGRILHAFSTWRPSSKLESI